VIVVADTSVLINLCRVGQGGLFQRLFQEVFIPPEVAAEFDRLAGQTTLCRPETPARNQTTITFPPADRRA
jgi:predicted nucleic acid-binding protein